MPLPAQRPLGWLGVGGHAMQYARCRSIPIGNLGACNMPKDGTFIRDGHRWRHGALRNVTMRFSYKALLVVIHKKPDPPNSVKVYPLQTN